jgi:alkylhydroperoxidase/carboxymuconolactone decarboxylase family protein YurZ
MGASQTEIEEVILQMAPYAGLPAARRAMEIAKKTFAEHKS